MEGVRWSPDSGFFFSSRESSCTSLYNGHTQLPEDEREGGMVIRAGVMPIYSSIQPVITTFDDIENGTQIHELSNGHKLIGAVKIEQPFEITVRSLVGKEFRPEVYASDTVGHLKELVHKQSGLPPDQQRLLYCGKNLCDDRKLLGYYNMQEMCRNGSKIFVTSRLRGG